MIPNYYCEYNNEVNELNEFISSENCTAIRVLINTRWSIKRNSFQKSFAQKYMELQARETRDSEKSFSEISAKIPGRECSSAS